MNRLAHLNARSERLIEMNRRHGYTIAGNPDGQRYTDLLFEIHKEKVAIWRENRQRSLQNYENAKQAVIGLIKKDLI